MQKIGTKISLTISDDLLKEVETISKKIKRSRSAVLRQLIIVGLSASISKPWIVRHATFKGIVK
jgi:metal-responsive CopG/Arc/MetJ family transcriptional regulator